jgi:hypothetical protein
MAVGSTCSGDSKWVTRTQRANNWWGMELFRLVLKTDFCYDGNQVTYASSSITGDVSGLGTIGGIDYNGSTSGITESFYNYRGRPNGGAKAEVQGSFSQSPIKVGDLGSTYPVLRTYVHYNGTWNTGGYCDEC